MRHYHGPLLPPACQRSKGQYSIFRLVFSIFALIFLPTFFIFSLLFLTPPQTAQAVVPNEDDAVTAPSTGQLSPRLIVELSSPPLAAAQFEMVRAAGASAKLDVSAASAQAYVAQLQAEQSLFAANLATALPEIKISQIRDESGVGREAAYNVIFNGLAVNIGGMSHGEATVALSQLDGVKAVYPDKAYEPLLYESVVETRAPEAWSLPAIGGFENAGRGIRIASIDSGVYGRSAMFSGEGYVYPPEFPVGGYGDEENNTGKVIVSRAYFRDWDGPLEGEDRGWPGPSGSSHGTHTASTAAGDLVTTTVNSVGDRTFSGMAPKAYVMSYKVNYGSELDMPFFFTAELLMAMEDAVADGADIVNNSWGGGPDSLGGEFDAVDTGLINLTKAGVFVSMSTGNAGPGTGTVDHPSPNYINAAAGYGTLANGSLTAFISEFSSRGPGVGNVLKPDITAPGDPIFAQGYGGGSGEQRHQGYGAVPGTSMAAPHVSGAVALLKQIHPDWSNEMIKSALMSTAQYVNIYKEEDSEPAQPLDMGAGWINVAAAADPGVMLDPPSLSFGQVVMNSQPTQKVQLTNITGMTDTYTVTTYYHADRGQLPSAIPGFVTLPPTLTVGPGETRSVNVTFDTTAGIGLGDNQGYIVLTGEQHAAHLPTWARISHPSSLADVLILDNDGSEANPSLYGDFAQPYMEALDELGYTYHVHPINKLSSTPTTVPDAANLGAYKAIIILTGVNGRAGIDDVLVQRFTEPEMDRIVEYLNNGGAVLGMGENMARVMLSNRTDDLRAPFLYRDIFRSNWIQDSVSFGAMPVTPITPSGVGPLSLSETLINVDNTSMDEIDFEYHNKWNGYLSYGGTPLFQYLGGGRRYFGIVGMMTREQPSLNSPGITYLGRSIYTTFGLENVVDNAPAVAEGQPISRTALVDSFLNVLWSEPAALEINATVPMTTGQPYTLALTVIGGFNLMGQVDDNALQLDEILWDYGDGSELQVTQSLAPRTHRYYFCDTYQLRAVAIDHNANIGLTTMEIDVTDFCIEPTKTFLPVVGN